MIEYDPMDYSNPCPVCGAELYWEDCGACGGEGFVDVYDNDPLWYDPGDTEPCEMCGGQGGWYLCLNYSNHPAVKAEQAQ